MPLPPVAFAFGAMILWGVGDFVIQKMSRRMSAVTALMWIYAVGSLSLLPFAVSDLSLIRSAGDAATLVFAGALECVFGLTLLKAYEKGKLSIVDVILLLELPLTVLLGVVFFSESLNALQIGLIFMIMCGAALVSRTEKERFKEMFSIRGFSRRTWEKGVLLAVSAAVISGVYNFTLAVNARNVSPLLTIWFAWSVGGILLSSYLAARGGFKKFLEESRGHLKLIALGSFLDIFAWLSFAVAISQKELSITTAITESYPAISVFLGVKFNREKISRVQYFGAFLALSASVCISLLEAG